MITPVLRELDASQIKAENKFQEVTRDKMYSKNATDSVMKRNGVIVQQYVHGNYVKTGSNTVWSPVEDIKKYLHTLYHVL
ncbi:hypothetical protein AYI69_g7901 [Smittium culicis]|uniref:Uncharacterized protein n=1 Tax=Smittium culicis TaxID=133412 RepID=A0A1R1XNQ9_9FUNG|nr:hypothetical protein AYI69_g7901 [Smittium culicis]